MPDLTTKRPRARDKGQDDGSVEMHGGGGAPEKEELSCPGTPHPVGKWICRAAIVPTDQGVPNKKKLRLWLDSQAS